MRREKLRITILILFISTISIQAQNCIQSFIKEIKITYETKNKRYNKKVIRILNNQLNEKFDDNEFVKVTNIPILFSTKKGSKIAEKRSFIKEKLLCYIDVKSMDFEEAMIYQDTLIFGSVFQFSNLKFIFDNDSLRIKFIRPLITEIRRINPDIIFRIYNIPRCYWYIKDNELFVLSYKHENVEMNSFITYNAFTFIEKYLKNEDLFFISHKRVIVIGGK